MIKTVRADTDGTSIYVTSDSFAHRDMVSLVGGAKWKANEGRWVLPLTFASCKQLRSILGDNLELGQALIEWGFEELNNRVTPCMLLRDLLSLEDTDVDPGLYPYQVAGASFLVTAGQALLGDPPGSGKSAQAITAARMIGEDTLPALVVAPKSTLIGWQREVERWWPGVPVQVVSGTREQRSGKILQVGEDKGFCILNWDILYRHSRLAPYGSMRLTEDQRTPKELNQVNWKLVIADEAHRMQKAQSVSTRAMWSIGHSDSVNYRWAMTGTPLTNKLDSLWSILHFMNPKDWPSRVHFIDRYCQVRPVPWGSGVEVIGPNQATQEEFQEIFQPRFRRMPKEVILPQLPPIVRTRRIIPMTGPQRKAYDQMAENMVAVTDSGELIIAANPAVKMLRMVQFSSATVDMVNTDPDSEDDVDMLARLVDPSNKLDALMDDLPDLLEAGEQVVVFAVSRQLIEMAEERLKKANIDFSVIKGGQKPDVRQSQIDSFQEGKVPVILVVISAGGVGVTLTAARIGIFLQRAWDFVSNHQAEGRLHRIGSEKHESVEYIDYVSEGTVDMHVIRVAEGKEFHLEQIVRDGDAVRRMLHGE